MSPRRGGWPLWFVLAVLLVLHFYVRPRLVPGRGAPDFLMIALLVYALRRSPGPAAVAGLITGLVTDVLEPAHFGAGMLAHTLVAWGAALGRGVFFADNLLVNAGVFAVGTWVRNLLVLLVAGAGTGSVLASLTIWSVLQAVTTALAGFVVVLGIRHRVDVRFDG